MFIVAITAVQSFERKKIEQNKEPDVLKHDAFQFEQNIWKYFFFDLVFSMLKGCWSATNVIFILYNSLWQNKPLYKVYRALKQLGFWNITFTKGKPVYIR